jgi:D-alanyl-D-alanine carboxypeptidase
MYVPTNLVDTHSKYKNSILVLDKVYKQFLLMQKDALNNDYRIDIMSGYRGYDYQEKIYSKLVNERGLNYAIRHVAPAGASEHQTGMAIDICVYRNENCYVEQEISDFEEMRWLHKNAHRYGFILRYIDGKEDITGYNYEPWHFRYVGDMAGYIYYNNLTLEEFYSL